jgi:hypothetical protein
MTREMIQKNQTDELPLTERQRLFIIACACRLNTRMDRLMTCPAKTSKLLLYAPDVDRAVASYIGIKVL